ncbi:MAG: NAD(P)/FAD-dependent oxidoreductase [Bdellovibrionales bacterium]
MRIRHPASAKGKKIVAVVGGGFGGLNAAKALAREPSLFVVLLDQKNHHLFQPLLYQVATAGLNSGDIAVPIRSQFDEENVQVHWAKIDAVNLKEQFLSIREGKGHIEMDYDFVVLACGAQHSYFGKSEWEEFAPGLKTLEQAVEIRRRILSAFELAENEFDEERQRALLTFVVVGGGPTGVELAGAIADISRTVLVKDFKRINPANAKVILVEAGPRVLAPFPEDLSQKAKRSLEKLGVEVRTSTRVENITAEGVQAGADFISSKTVLWGAGVQAVNIELEPEVQRDRAGRIQVEKDLSIPGFPNAFAIGDMAAFKMPDGKLVPGLAPAAMQEGRHVAKVIRSRVLGQTPDPFTYKDKGQIATIGKNHAVMESGKLKLSGKPAWLAWLFVHVFYLVGFKNRMFVVLQWAWSYLFSKRGARLITESGWQLDTVPRDSQAKRATSDSFSKITDAPVPTSAPLPQVEVKRGQTYGSPRDLQQRFT